MEITVRGHRCVYELTGQGPYLTLLHSVGLSTREGWRSQIPYLAKSFTVLSYDFRGLGESDRGALPLGVETFVKDLEELLQKLSITKTALMGISLGGFVAQAFALKRPELISALVLVSTTCRIYAGHAQRRAERNERIRREGMATAADHQLESHFPVEFAKANPEVLDWYKRHYVRNDPDSYISIMEDLGRFDSSARLPTLRCPTLIVGGGADSTSVAGQAPLDSAKRLRELIPGAEMIAIDNAFHYPHIDHADLFNAQVGKFLATNLSHK